MRLNKPLLSFSNVLIFFFNELICKINSSWLSLRLFWTRSSSFSIVVNWLLLCSMSSFICAIICFSLSTSCSYLFLFSSIQFSRFFISSFSSAVSVLWLVFSSVFFLSRFWHLSTNLSFSLVSSAVFWSYWFCKSLILDSRSLTVCSSLDVMASFSVFICCNFLVCCTFKFSVSFLNCFSISAFSFLILSAISSFVVLRVVSYCSRNFNISLRSLSSCACNFFFCDSSFSLSAVKWEFLFSKSCSRSVILTSYFLTISLCLSMSCCFSWSKFASISLFSFSHFSLRDVLISVIFNL